MRLSDPEYRLKLSLDELFQAMTPARPTIRRRPRSNAATIYVCAPYRPDAHRSPELSSLRAVFSTSESRRVLNASGPMFRSDVDAETPPDSFKYRDPWDLPRTGSFRKSSLEAISDAAYVLAIVSGLSPGVAYEVGYAMGKGKPIGLLWAQRQGQAEQPFHPELLPNALLKQHIVVFDDTNLPEAFEGLHTQLVSQRGRRRCPKCDEDVECEYLQEISAEKRASTARNVLAVFQPAHHQQFQAMNSAVEETGYRVLTIGDGPRNEGNLCRLCYLLRCADRVIVDVTASPSSTGSALSESAPDKQPMFVAGMARALGRDTLHVYDGRAAQQAMIEGELGYWTSNYETELRDRWLDFTNASRETRK